MEYRAIIYFTDLQDSNYAYQPGDVFPRNGYAVSKERLAELSTSKNRRGRAVIELVEEPKAEPEEIKEETEKPKPKRTRKKKDAD